MPLGTDYRFLSGWQKASSHSCFFVQTARLLFSTQAHRYAKHICLCGLWGFSTAWEYWCLRLPSTRMPCCFADSLSAVLSFRCCWPNFCSFCVFPSAYRLPPHSLLLRFSFGDTILSSAQCHWCLHSFWSRFPRRFFSGWRFALSSSNLYLTKPELFDKCFQKLDW